MRFFGRPIAAATPLGAMLRVALLAVAASVGWSGPVSAGVGRQDRTAAVGFALGVCLCGIVGNWAAARRSGTTPAARVATSLAAISLRVFPALVALGWLQTAAGARLREAGAASMLVAFYLLNLAADVILNTIGACKPVPPSGSRIVN